MNPYSQIFTRTLSGIFLLYSLSSAALAASVELSLGDSVTLALNNNPTIKIAEAGREKSLWGVEQAKAGKGVTLGYTHTDTRSDKSSTSLAVVPVNNLFSNQLSLSLPIYTGGKLESLI